MCRNSIFTKRWVKGSAVLVATAATLVFANPQQAIATPLKGVESATVSQSASNVVDIDFAGGIAVSGSLRGTPLMNSLLLLIGTVLASWVGTTGAAMVKVLNTGQACICPNRLYVQRGIADAFVEALAAGAHG